MTGQNPSSRGDHAAVRDSDATAPSDGPDRDPFLVSRRVEFRDTDAAGIVHFSAFFPMMEAAEHELLRHLGIEVLPPADQQPRLTWPRVSAQCDYHQAARFEDVLSIGVCIEHIGRSSVRYRFEFTRDGDSIATGHLTTVCCELSDDGLRKHALAADLVERMRRYETPA